MMDLDEFIRELTAAVTKLGGVPKWANGAIRIDHDGCEFCPITIVAEHKGFAPERSTGRDHVSACFYTPSRKRLGLTSDLASHIVNAADWGLNTHYRGTERGRLAERMRKAVEDGWCRQGAQT